MRLLILAAAATVAVTGTATASNSANRVLSSGDTLSAHEFKMKNLHDAGLKHSVSSAQLVYAHNHVPAQSETWGMRPPNKLTPVYTMSTHEAYLKNLSDSGNSRRTER